MKQCPICDTNYPDEHTTCDTDGALLIEIREWAPGTMVRGKYRILAKVGKGGMGIVYKATHIVFEEVWALKVMAAHLAADPKFVRRFRQEAQVTRKLQHINTVRVQDFDQAEDGSPFIVMDYIDGVSLRQLLQATKGPLPIARSLWIARGMAEGLNAAHGLGMVHRDIKPENILLARDSEGRDVPKILDFGIVAMREGSTSLSQGLLLTAAYGSPEQWRGMKAAELDGRADLYALGVTLYEMLTGRLPFHAHTDAGWMKAHLEETPPPPSQFNPELAQLPAIDELVLKLLAKERENRPKDAHAFLNELNLLDAQLSWGQPTIVGRRKDAELMQTVVSRPTGEGGQGITTHPEPAQVPQAPQRDLAAEKQKAEAEARAKAEEDARAKAEARAKAAADAERARRERQRPSRKTLIGAAVGVVLAVVVTGAWFFLRARPNPLVELGIKYEKGDGVPKDLGKAADLYRQAAEKGDAAGQFHLGTMYRDGDGVEKDPTKAAEFFTKSANQNYADAENELGFAYQHGIGMSQDDAMAVNWYRKAAEQGNSAAQVNLGWMYNTGHGVAKDDALAASWYGRAAKQGNPVGQYDLGWMYEFGHGVARDDARAADWYRKAAQQGYPNAQDRLGFMYDTGSGVPKDKAQAVSWYRKAAEQGYPGAQYTLGLKYEVGEDVPKDDAVAASWYRKAAEQGEPESQLRLGLMCKRGDGVPKDAVTAASWFRKSAEQGNSNAQENLGQMYEDGDGVRKDLVDAYKWTSLGMGDSFDKEQTLIGGLSFPSREADLERQMTPAQIEEAKRRVNEWKAQHPVSSQ